MMKSTSALKKKGTAGADVFRRKDKDRDATKFSFKSGSSSSSPSSSSRIGSPKTSPAAAATRKPKPAHHPKQTNMPLSNSPITLDLHRFADSNMNPEEFVRRSLADTNEEGIRAFHRSLVEAKHVIGGDLQRNVYRNYTEFVTISKEVSNLDADVFRLKGYLNELKSIWEGFVEEANPSEDMKPIDAIGLNDAILPQRKHSDMIPSDLQSIFRAQIAALWENVEGSQRFVAYTQGRHIVRECANFFDINPKTLQPRQAVHIFLLNDCLLVASRKKRSATSKYKLVADHCWSLDEVTIIDVKDSTAAVNAIKISVYPNTYIYRSERQEDKYALLHAYHRTMDENSDRQDDASNPIGYRNGKDAPAGAGDNQRAREGQDSDIEPGDRKWLEDLPDELEVVIALRQFETAVGYIEQAKKMLDSYPQPTPLLRASKSRVQKYSESLASIISQDLQNTLLTKLQFQRLVNWLLRLDKGDEAREVFLNTRSLIIKKRIRQLTFEGDSTTYINELALVVFTLIRNTCEWYRDSFKQNEMASRFITWVREQTEIYADIYKRQVFNHSQLNCQIIADCFKSTLDQCSILRKVGLDLKFMLEDFFLDNVRETVLAYERRCADKAEKFARGDNFSVVSSQNLGGDVRVTSSVISFYNMLIKFVNDICLIAKLQLYETVVRSISRVTEHYLRTMVDQSNGQRSVASMNIGFVLDNVVPRVSSQLNRHFDRPIPELDSLRARLRGLAN
ncbi:nuclear mrna via spliceosome-related [Lichtheimia corymbifera JMRC:FSU:9682]|uniref:Exocyst complex component EXO84 n=1 Tax=Lichtheimia corymbifera JMRC:FSU:9682 TaxID=1263082 RepID=A0A068RLC7_9FUNG|nr:nuclear mrna via spliceosome-related [Lichtheimia corymbifera JMRC:FSU:9682]